MSRTESPYTRQQQKLLVVPLPIHTRGSAPSSRRSTPGHSRSSSVGEHHQASRVQRSSSANSSGHNLALRPRPAPLYAVAHDRSAPVRHHVDPARDPRQTNHKGFVRCRWCSVFTVDDPDAIDEHHGECPFAPLQCDFVDTETGVRCAKVCKGPKLLAKHQARCPVRAIPCTNYCDAAVSVQSMARHALHCSQQQVRCSACGDKFTRSAEDEHATHCLEVLVECPLGCGEELRRGEVPAHIRDRAMTHLPRVPFRHNHPVDTQHPLDSPTVVYSVLLSRLHDLAKEVRRDEESAQRRRSAAAPSAPSPSTTSDPAATEQSEPAAAAGEASASPPRNTRRAFIAQSDVGAVEALSDTAERVEAASALVQRLHDGLGAYTSRDAILACDDVASDGTRAATLRRLQGGLEAEWAHVATLKGLCHCSSAAPTPAQRALATLAKSAERRWFDVRCAFYDCSA